MAINASELEQRPTTEVERRAFSYAMGRFNHFERYLAGDPTQPSFSVCFGVSDGFHKLMHNYFLDAVERLNDSTLSREISACEEPIYTTNGVTLKRKGIESLRWQGYDVEPLAGVVESVIYFATREEEGATS